MNVNKGLLKTSHGGGGGGRGGGGGGGREECGRTRGSRKCSSERKSKMR